MTTLEKLYSIIANAADCNVKLGDDVYRQIAEMEETLITDEVVPVIRDTIAPILGNIKRELTLIVDYKPGSPVNVLISRKGRVYKEGDFVQISINNPDAPNPGLSNDEDEEPLHHTYGHKQRIKTPAPATRLRIIRPDGSILQEMTAAQTLAAAVKEAGYENVRKLGQKTNKVPLVDFKKDSVYGGAQIEIARGVFVITSSSTAFKQKQLQEISESLRLGWRIEIVNG